MTDKTLYEKIWERHAVATGPGGRTASYLTDPWIAATVGLAVPSGGLVPGKADEEVMRRWSSYRD